MPGTSTPRRPRVKKAEDALAVETAAEESVRTVNGMKVVADDPVYSHLPTRAGAPPIAFRGLRLLTLEDESQVHACADCEHTGARGDVMVHRTQKHGAGTPGRRRQEPGIPPEVLAMTIGELLHLAGGINAWERMFEQQAADTTQWKERALAAESQVQTFNKLLGKVGYAKVEE